MVFFSVVWMLRLALAPVPYCLFSAALLDYLTFFPDLDLISQFGYLYRLKSASSHRGGALGSCGYWSAILMSASLLTSCVILEKSFWMQFSKALLKVSETSAPKLLQPFRALFCVFVVCLSSHLSS